MLNEFKRSTLRLLAAFAASGIALSSGMAFADDAAGSGSASGSGQGYDASAEAA